MSTSPEISSDGLCNTAISLRLEETLLNRSWHETARLILIGAVEEGLFFSVLRLVFLRSCCWRDVNGLLSDSAKGFTTVLSLFFYSVRFDFLNARSHYHFSFAKSTEFLNSNRFFSSRALAYTTFYGCYCIKNIFFLRFSISCCVFRFCLYFASNFKTFVWVE
jgi:hypothetical protein